MSATHNTQILIYAQHLSGVGHYVRTHEIARVLSKRFRVHWVEGGRPVPRRPCPELIPIELPRIRRGSDGSLQGLDPEHPIKRILQQRRRVLLEAISTIRPAVFLVEYFPFSKWELASELIPALHLMRQQGGLVLCSIRDIVRQTRFEAVSKDSYHERVIRCLGNYFDALLVHADPSLIRLEDSFSAANAIPVPIHYTGLVSEQLRPIPGGQRAIDELCQGKPYGLVSTGGSNGGRSLMAAAIEAWRDPQVAADRLLVICGGLGDESIDWEAMASDQRERIRLLPFRGDFLQWLAAAQISISQCGYNTAANLLQIGLPAVVSPHPQMSDQAFRAQCLAARDLVTHGGDDLSPEALGDAIKQAERKTLMPDQSLNLNGAQESTRVIAELLRH